LVKWAIVVVQGLHHGQVRADQDEQHGFAGQVPVPRHLQDALEPVRFIHQVREFVEDDDARAVVGQGSCEQTQCVAPVLRMRGSEKVATRQ
jgi:hypothetical protein